MVSASQSATKTANKAKATSLSYARLAAAQRNLTVHLKTHQGLNNNNNNNNKGDNNNMGDEGTSAPTTNATTTAVSRVLNTLFQEEDATATHRFEQQLNVLLDMTSTVRRFSHFPQSEGFVVDF